MRTIKSPNDNLLETLSVKPSLINKIEERLINDGKIGINVGLQEGLILKSLCAQDSVNKVVEIGTQYGCSASWMALGLKKGAKIFCFENDVNHIIEAQKTFNEAGFLELHVQVQLFAGKALEQLPNIEQEGPFDLIFIDANKTSYWDYFQWALKNISKGGLIVADNVYLFGTQFLSECPEGTPLKMWLAMRKVLVEAFSNPSLSSSIIPTQEGMLVSVKN
jgi:predicted O-methyltransferase YrrM